MSKSKCGGGATHLGEQSLDLVLEGKVKRLGGEVPDDVGGVPSPERGDSLLLLYASEAAICVSGVVSGFGRRREIERARTKQGRSAQNEDEGEKVSSGAAAAVFACNCG